MSHENNDIAQQQEPEHRNEANEGENQRNDEDNGISDEDNDHNVRIGFIQSLVRRRRINFQDRYRCIVVRARMNENGGPTPDGQFQYEFQTRLFKSEKQQPNVIGGEIQEYKERNSMRPPDSCVANKEDIFQPVQNDCQDGGEGDENDEEIGPSCAICFLSLEDGDRVGKIE